MYNMKTDWGLIRDTLNAAIDSCEALEQAGYDEQHRTLTIDVDGKPITVQAFLISAWTMPERVRYHIIRARHDSGIDLPYVPETARVLNAVAAACAELVGAGDHPPAKAAIQGMSHWYRNHFDAYVPNAIMSRKDSTG
jgi:hypothetical protein